MEDENKYLIRVIDQTTGRLKAYYNSLTEEQFNEICTLLNIKDDDWD